MTWRRELAGTPASRRRKVKTGTTEVVLRERMSGHMAAMRRRSAEERPAAERRNEIRDLTSAAAAERSGGWVSARAKRSIPRESRKSILSRKSE